MSLTVLDPTDETTPEPRVRTALFVIADKVYNSELMAPYDVLHHTIFRDELDYIEPFVVSPDGGPVTTFEGLEVAAQLASLKSTALMNSSVTTTRFTPTRFILLTSCAIPKR